MPKLVFHALALLAVFLVAGCLQQEAGQGGPTCSEGWKCKNASVQAFQRTDCSWTSEKVCDLGCENSVCKTPPKTEVRTRMGDTEMLITPTNNSQVKGIITITMTHVPQGTKLVAFAIQGPSIEDISKTGPNLGFDSDATDGWSIILDTTKYGNGVYDVYSFTSNLSEPKEGEPPTGGARAQIVVQN